MSPEWSARAEEFGAMVCEVVAMVDEATADPDLTFERAAAVSRATENIVAAIQGLISQLRLQGTNTGFIEALEQMLGRLWAADMRAGKLVIQASGILEVA